MPPRHRRPARAEGGVRTPTRRAVALLVAILAASSGCTYGGPIPLPGAPGGPTSLAPSCARLRGRGYTGLSRVRQVWTTTCTGASYQQLRLGNQLRSGCSCRQDARRCMTACRFTVSFAHPGRRVQRKGQRLRSRHAERRRPDAFRSCGRTGGSALANATWHRSGR